MSRDVPNIFKNLALLTHIGMIMMIPIFGAVYLGSLVDEKLGTNHIFLIVFIILGVGSGFLNVYKTIMKNIKKQK
ncbi:AtpZ/AtpI family protein [Crassaminicella profunda]|uniref:AtpZ/AtpI family protein n=1 Tax=Crassaminicella profunda TaxID=1286698 RepID=UPI001CA61DA7|nr:AtpZ/AtpI family protein [Crassaminicella profunda]QZY55519.1 AtpZ/AtpI family protein [Crassaminicella profunda]